MLWFKRIWKAESEDSEYASLLPFTPQRSELYKLAFTHASAHITNGDGKVLCNERLEYLGDAVISLVVAQYLYETFPNAGEGTMTNQRSQLVKRKHLNEVGNKLGFDRYLCVGKAIKNNAENRIGNAVEAFVGAIYEDAGFEQAAAFVKKHIISEYKDKLNKEDYKSQLLEFGQARHIQIEFVLENEKYDSYTDTHTFYITIFADGKAIAEAAGATKKEAQQTAASKALKQLKQIPNEVIKSPKLEK